MSEQPREKKNTLVVIIFVGLLILPVTYGIVRLLMDSSRKPNTSVPAADTAGKAK